MALPTRILAAVLIAAAGQAGFAQVQQVQMGRALDANPQVGAGGSNKPVAGFVPLNANEIMSGNVTGLSYFHGSSVAISPYSFQGRLGTSALAGFARQSAGSDINPTPLNKSFYLPSATVSTAQGNLYSAPVGSGFDSQLVPRAAISPLATPQQIRSLQPTNAATEAPQAELMRGGEAAPEPGTPGAVLSSPLFGLRIPEKQEVSFGEKEAGIDKETGAATGEGTEANQGENGTGQGQKPAKTPGILDTLNPGREDVRRDAPQARMETRRDTRIGGTYLELMDDLKRAEAEGNQGAGGGGGEAPVQVVMPKGMGMPDVLGDEIDPLTGLPRRVTLRSTPGRGGAIGTGAKGSDASVSSKRLEDLPEATLQAGTNVKPLKTFVSAPAAGEASAAVDVLMTRAEESMKHGRYLEAAESYQNAMARDAGNPLPVVGRAHAELGAGMYQSAAYDLKFIFTRNPKMVAVHYDLNAFIGQTRQQYLTHDLTTLSHSKDVANTASFLLCYFYYQTGKQELLKTELKRWQDAPEHDNWPSVLTRAWTGSKSEGGRAP